MGFNENEYNSLQKDVSDLRVNLNSINEKKEEWYSKKENLKKEINNLIAEIKQIRNERDKRSTELQELKKQRDKYNEEVQMLIQKIKKLNKEKSKTYKKYNIKIDPKNIQVKINELESKVEIETNFEKEKKLMEEINKLKKSYAQNSEVFELGKKSEELAIEIKNSRSKADEFHRKIQEIARDSNYDLFITLSNKITETKKIQEDAFQKFIEYKDEYAKASQDLKSKIEALNLLKQSVSDNRQLQKIKAKEREHRIIEEKTKKVEEKLKNNKRLTTEDLLVFQGQI